MGEFDPAMAPLLLSYGKALYELAFSTQGVMGKEEVNKVALRSGELSFPFKHDVLIKLKGKDEGESISKPNFVFEGDGEDVEEEPELGNATAGPSTIPDQEGEGAGGGEGEAEGEGEGEGEGDEPEDDYNAAWEVLDVARTIYSKIVEEKGAREDELNLAECYLSLGDVSLETGKSISPLKSQMGWSELTI